MSERICSIDYCEKPRYVRGFCTRHYNRWLKYGDPEYPMQPRGPAPKPRMAPVSQVCSNCGTDKPASEFRVNRARPSQIDAKCKVCASRYAAERKAARLEAHKATQREWARRKREADPEGYRAHNRAVYEARAEVVKERMRKWWADNPDRAREHEARRRRLKASTRVDRVKLSELWTGFCAACDEPLTKGIRFPDPRSPSIDHIVPLSRGGTHTQDNLRYTCLGCNLRKGARPIEPSALPKADDEHDDADGAARNDSQAEQQDC